METINYGRNKFYDTGPKTLSIITLIIMILYVAMVSAVVPYVLLHHKELDRERERESCTDSALQELDHLSIS